MSQRFPHLAGAPQAFGPGREVYEQIPGEFDQSRWSQATARAKLISVPWCGDHDNVVAFGSDEARDAWIDAAPGYAFETAWRRPPEGTYKVEVPYTSALEYNYLVLDFPTPTSEGSPLPGTSETRLSRLCYFVDDARPSAGSTTELSIELDAWTTFIGSVQVSYLQLVQGHAPMVEVSPEQFLADPLATSRHLLVPDVNAGEAAMAASEHACVLDDATLAVIITTSALDGAWGEKYGSTPTDPISFSGAPASPEAWALAADDLESFLTDVTAQHPSFLQTVLAVASVPSSLLTLEAAVSFCGHNVSRCAPTGATLPLIDLDVADFGYEDAYERIAKLYTSPYAHIEVTDETGSVAIVRVEDTQGALSVAAQLSLAWPYLSVETTLTGTGRASAAAQLSWQVLGRSAGASLAGRWYETLVSHEIPTFAVRESGATSYDWSAHWTNEQRDTAATNTYDSALASNATARTNVSNSASNVTSNNAVTVAANSEIATRVSNAAITGAQYSNTKISEDQAADVQSMASSLEAEQATLAVAATNNNAQAVASGVGTIAGGIAETAASLLSGDIGGAVGAVASTIGGAVQQGVSWNAANASISVSQSNSVTLYSANVAASQAKLSNATSFTTSSTTLDRTTKLENVETQNTAATSIASNNAALMNTNATNVKTTADANASRALSTAQSAIAHDTAQAALGSPVSHGEQRPRLSGARPMMVQATVVTEAPGEIAFAGDHMLRFGYACDFAWQVTDWCPCERFCFWRASDVWLAPTGGNVAERYQRAIKDILIRGVTIWKRPEDIGAVSVYDNGF